MRTDDFSFIFELDPYENALENELERLDQEGLLVLRKVTPEERAMYHQTSINTRKALREGKRWMIERRSKHADFSEELTRIFHTDSSRGAAQHDADKADEDFGAELYWTYRSSLNRSPTQSASCSRKPQQNWDEISGLMACLSPAAQEE